MYRKLFWVLLFPAFVSACTLDKIQEGKLCPPGDASDAKVYLFESGAPVEWNDVRCPDAHPRCNAFTSADQLFGHYYCFSPCQGRQISCDGICTEISNASAECKAVNNSDVTEQSDPGCSDNSPDCHPTQCTSSSCDGDYVMLCVDGVYKKHEPACPYGCKDGVCITKPGGKECVSDNLRCEQGNLQICQDNEWILKELCTNGCNEVTLSCHAASEPVPDQCATGEKKCEENFVSECIGGVWQKAASVCPNGCENGECRQKDVTPTPIEDVTPPPIVGSGDNYCEGQILHYIDNNGISKTTDCSFFAAYGVECQVLKDGSADCVYNHNEVAKACKQENEIASPQCADAAELGIEAGVKVALSVVRCTLNSNNELVGVNEISISTCAIYKNQKAAILCASQGDGTVEPAVSSCPGCYENKPFAICDGEPLYDMALSSYDPKNLAACTKANCITPTNQSCLDVCHANGKPYCYSVVGSSSYFCSEVEMEATGSGG